MKQITFWGYVNIGSGSDKMLWCTSWTMQCWNSFVKVIGKISTIFFSLQCDKSLKPDDAFMCESIVSSLVHVMAWRLIGAKPLHEPMLTNYQLNH